MLLSLLLGEAFWFDASGGVEAARAAAERLAAARRPGSGAAVGGAR